jgi:glycosyltransferase involved in cell wall biosynthesis
LARHLGDARWCIATREDAQNESLEATVLPVIPSDFSASGLRTVLSGRKIASALAGLAVDIVVCNVEPYLPLAARIRSVLEKRQRSKVGLLLVAHGTYAYYPFVSGRARWLWKMAGRAVDAVVAPSLFTAERVRAWYGGPVHVVPWGVDLERYFALPGVRKEHSFVSVGQPKARKGTDVLLRAFAAARARHPSARLYIVGGGDARYERLARELGVADAVHFTGPVKHEELLQYYSRSLAHVLPSVNTGRAFEGFGLVHLEANACGLPTIGSRGTANQEVIVEGKTGFLCAQGDTDGVARAMLWLLENAQGRQRMAVAARRHAEACTWDSAAVDFAHVAEAVVRARRGSVSL